MAFIYERCCQIIDTFEQITLEHGNGHKSVLDQNPLLGWTNPVLNQKIPAKPHLLQHTGQAEDSSMTVFEFLPFDDHSVSMFLLEEKRT